MTAVIFYTGFIGIYGFIIGKSFKRLNPFYMLLGMLFSILVIAQVEQKSQPLLYIPLAVGFFANFCNPFRIALGFFPELKIYMELSQASRQRKKEQKRRKKERTKEHAKQNKRNSTNQSYQQNNNYSKQQRQIQAEQERLRRQAEELRQQREQFQREQAQARRNQNNQSSSNNGDLNPNDFADACEILGCNPNDNLAILKKAYRYLRAMYHPDKMEQLGGRRKKQAEEEMKLINLAWTSVQEKHRHI